MLDFSSSYYQYEQIMARCLANVLATLDKREGSIIFDALGPACAELAQAYAEMQNIMIQTYGLTAAGTYQDYRYAEAGLTRKAAIYAVRRGIFEDANNAAFAVPIGSRFSTPAGANSVVFDVTGPYLDSAGNPVAGQYLLTAETPDVIGNGYSGAIIPISYINGLASAVIDDVIVAGEPAEQDAAFLARWLEAINNKPFGGNIEDYRQAILAIDGVGAVQVYPIWAGGGTVKCSIISTAWAPAASTLISSVQTAIDPAATPGLGIGTAPIGHVVTIATATDATVDIAATLTLGAGVTVGQVQAPIEAACDAYFLKVQQAWGTPQSQILNNYVVGIFKAQLIAAMVGVPGVLNVNALTLSGAGLTITSNGDVSCTETAALQQLPVRGVVTLGT